MKQQIIFMMILLFFSCSADAISNVIKKKYPHSILTNDYGILNEMDLKDEKSAPFSPGESTGYVYWQCFPRDYLRIQLEDLGYTSEDIGGKENYSGLKITASNNSGISHEYVMRRRWPLSTYEKRFNLWIKLMKGEKYVCIAGRFFTCKDKVMSGRNWQVCEWVFEKIKTKKGCDSYFIHQYYRSY